MPKPRKFVKPISSESEYKSEESPVQRRTYHLRDSSSFRASDRTQGRDRRSQARDTSVGQRPHISSRSNNRSQNKDELSTSRRISNVSLANSQDRVYSSTSQHDPSRQAVRKRKTSTQNDGSSISSRQSQQMSLRSIKKHKGNLSSQSQGIRDLSQDLSRPRPSGISRRISSQPSNRPPTPTRTSGGNPGNISRDPRKHRLKPGQTAFKKPRLYQRTTNLVLRKLPFAQVIQEITANRYGEFLWEATALEALQEASEVYLVTWFKITSLGSIQFGRENRDLLSYERRSETAVGKIERQMFIKPWIFKLIKDQVHRDISSERFDILKNYSNYGLKPWGSDTEGVEKTKRFLLECLSFLYRYIPAGSLERSPQRINERPSAYFGRNDLETLMASLS